VLPDGCVDVLVFGHGRPEAARVVGTMKHAFVAPAHAGAFFGIRFRPGEAARLLPAASRELTDTEAPLAALWGDEGRALEAALVELLDDAVTKHLAAEQILARAGAAVESTLRALGASAHAALHRARRHRAEDVRAGDATPARCRAPRRGHRAIGRGIPCGIRRSGTFHERFGRSRRHHAARSRAGAVGFVQDGPPRRELERGLQKELLMPIVPDMVGMSVKDVPRAIRFYRLLGLPFPDAAPGEDYVEVKTNGYRISLNAQSLEKELIPNWTEPRGQRMGLAFLCESPAQVDATYATVIAAGHQGVKEPWDAFWGQRYALVEDPDGAHVSLFCPLAAK
jgi:uncharacterized glyoxalase superfamily protein PhnB